MPSTVKNAAKQENVIPISIPETLTKKASEGFFGPDSWHWKLYREPTIIVAGISALLLQLAHPAVAEGVKVYSHYQSDFFGRAHRTVISMTRIWFGSREEAIQSAMCLHHIHQRVRGFYVEEKKGVSTKKAYCAGDVPLLIWVLGTMIQATIEGYTKTCRPLSEAEKDAFYQETKISAQLMGISLADYPIDWAAFQKYYDSLIAGDDLRVGKTGYAIAQAVYPAYFPFSGIVKTLAAGFLPDRLREAFALPKRQRLFSFLIKSIYIGGLITPSKWMYAPHYYRALYRIAKAKGQKPALFARLHHWIGKNIKLPLISSRLRL